MFQVEIKINGVMSCVSSMGPTKKAAIAEVKANNPNAQYVRCWEGNSPTTKSPIGPSIESIKAKLKKKTKNEVDITTG